jgi:hypothetical protein
MRVDLFAFGVVCLVIALGPARSGIGNSAMHKGLVAVEDRARRTAEAMAEIASLGPWAVRAVVPLLALDPQYREQVYHN